MRLLFLAHKYSLVGMFLTYNFINTETMRSTMLDLWYPLGGVTIIEKEVKPFVFKFFNIVDYERIIGGFS